MKDVLHRRDSVASELHAERELHNAIGRKVRHHGGARSSEDLPGFFLEILYEVAELAGGHVWCVGRQVELRALVEVDLMRLAFRCVCFCGSEVHRCTLSKHRQRLVIGPSFRDFYMESDKTRFPASASLALSYFRPRQVVQTQATCKCVQHTSRNRTAER